MTHLTLYHYIIIILHNAEIHYIIECDTKTVLVRPHVHADAPYQGTQLSPSMRRA